MLTMDNTTLAMQAVLLWGLLHPAQLRTTDQGSQQRKSNGNLMSLVGVAECMPRLLAQCAAVYVGQIFWLTPQASCGFARA